MKNLRLPLAAGAALICGLASLAVPLVSSAEEPLPTPSPHPLPTRRPTPQPQVTPAPMRQEVGFRPGSVMRLDGVAAGKPGRVDFFFRTSGRTYRVVPWNPDLLTQIRGGDGIRVFGWVDGLMITGANIRTTGSRVANSPDDYDATNVHNLTTAPGGGKRESAPVSGQ